MPQMHHQQNSPLVLCDACPRSYHAMCLELDFHQLPEEGEWACPKCIEKETKQARREGRTIGWVYLFFLLLLCNMHWLGHNSTVSGYLCAAVQSASLPSNLAQNSIGWHAHPCRGP